LPELREEEEEEEEEEEVRGGAEPLPELRAAEVRESVGRP